MDQHLARAFGNDIPVGQKILERSIRRDFVKQASDAGLDLAAMSDASVEDAYRTYRGLYGLRANQMLKEAEAVRAGRELARSMFDRPTSKTAAPADVTDPRVVQELQAIFDPKNLTPEAAEVRKLFARNPSGAMRHLFATGVPEDVVRELGEHSHLDRSVLDPMFKQWANDEELKAVLAERRLQFDHLLKNPSEHGATTFPKGMDAWAHIERAAAPEVGESAIERWLPVNLGKAFKGRNWGAVARKLGPVGALVGGLAYMKSRDLPALPPGPPMPAVGMQPR